MAAVTPLAAGLVLLSVLAQLVGIYLMPLTKGLTAPLPTLGFALAYGVGIALLPRIAHMGINLSLFIPFVAALVPLGAVALGVLAYGEPASLAKIGILVTACVLIGVANAV